MFPSGMPIYPLSPCYIWKGEYEPVRYDVHPIVKWLAKYLPIDPWIDGFKPLLVDDHADKIYQVGNYLCLTNHHNAAKYILHYVLR